MTDINPSCITPNIRQALRILRDLPGCLEAEDDPVFTSEQVSFLEKRLYEVRALLDGNPPDDEAPDFDLRVHERLAKRSQIAAIWSIEDVQSVRPDLTDDQAWEVLEQVGSTHDAEWGINWTTLETVADDLYPETPAEKETRHGN